MNAEYKDRIITLHLFSNEVGQILDGLHADVMRLQAQTRSFREVQVTLGRALAKPFLKVCQGIAKHRIRYSSTRLTNVA